MISNGEDSFVWKSIKKKSANVMLGNGRTTLSLSESTEDSSFVLYNRDPLPDFVSQLHSKLNVSTAAAIETISNSSQQDGDLSTRSMNTDNSVHSHHYKWVPLIEELVHMLEKHQFEQFSRLVACKNQLDCAQVLYFSLLLVYLISHFFVVFGHLFCTIFHQTRVGIFL